MNAEIFAEWFRRQGKHVIRTESTYWYDSGNRVFQAFPYHWTINPSEKELRSLLVENSAIALRYSSPFVASKGIESYHVICDDPEYELKSLKRQARQNVKRGLKFAIIEPIPIERLADEGWHLRQETLTRQGRAGAETAEWWRHLCLSAVGLPGFEAWGAICNGQLAASFLAFKCGDCYTLPYEQSGTDFLETRVNNAIFYFVTHEALKRDDVSFVFFCLQSLDAPTNVDQFKFRMGYTAKPVRQRVVFHPLIAPIVNTFSYKLVQRILRRYPGNYLFSKAEGMLRFYLQGIRPI